MTLFRILFAIDALVALVVLYFFVAGLGDGSVSSFNGGLWAGLLLTIAVVLGGGFALNTNGYRRSARAVLAILAVPGLLYAAFILLIVVTQPNWH